MKGVLDTWGDSSTGEILDYVYFRTEPMEHGIRSEALDFSWIQQEAAPQYVRQASGKTPQEIRQLRTKFREAAARREVESDRKFDFTAPRYDQEFLDALSKLGGTDL